MGNISTDDARHVLFHFGEGGVPAGSFTTLLIKAFSLGNHQEKEKLSLVYPSMAAAFDKALEGASGFQELRKIAGL